MTLWTLRLSAWDKQVHAFAPDQTESTWEAACRHTAPTRFIAECPDHLPTCTLCLIQFGDAIAARQEDQRSRIAAGVREEFGRFDGDKAFR